MRLNLDATLLVTTRPGYNPARLQPGPALRLRCRGRVRRRAVTPPPTGLAQAAGLPSVS
jgi:hypothetical protein